MLHRLARVTQNPDMLTNVVSRQESKWSSTSDGVQLALKEFAICQPLAIDSQLHVGIVTFFRFLFWSNNPQKGSTPPYSLFRSQLSPGTKRDENSRLPWLIERFEAERAMSWMQHAQREAH